MRATQKSLAPNEAFLEEKSGEWAISRKRTRQSNRTRQKNKRGRKVELNDRPKIPDRKETSDVPDLPTGTYTHSYKHTHTHKYTHKHTRTNTHIHTQTHTHKHHTQIHISTPHLLNSPKDLRATGHSGHGMFQYIKMMLYLGDHFLDSLVYTHLIQELHTKIGAATDLKCKMFRQRHKK